MKPGAYVVGRALQMGGLAKYGTHEFIVLVPESSGKFGYVTKDLGDGSLGLIVGAYNVNGKLTASYFAPSDTETLHVFLTDPTNGTRVQIEKVNLEKSMCIVSIDSILQRIANEAQNYINKSGGNLPNYPDGLMGQFSSSCRNSNSWAQTVIELAVGPNAVLEDFDGLDLCGDKRLPATYFQN